MHVAALRVDLRIGHARSLKDKRQVIRSMLDGARRRFGVSASEVGAQDSWQRAVLGFAVVASSARRADEVLDSVDAWVWSHPEVEVVDVERTWLG